MSTLYQDLPLTNFPSSLDTFTTWLNVTATDGPLIAQYLSAMNAGNQVLANQILSQISAASQKIITATDLNQMTQAIQAVERFYLTDVQPYIENQQESWLNIINQFSYKGQWSSGTAYQTNNIVLYTISGLNLLYIAIQNPPTGTPPNNSAYWRVLTIQGQPGPSGTGLSYRQEWSTSTSYSVNDAVSYGGSIWLATQPSQNQTPSEGSDYWQLVISLAATTYPIQDNEPSTLEVGGLWFNTSDNPTKYYYLETLGNPATSNQIIYGYEAYDDEGNVITGSLAVPISLTVTTNPTKMSYSVGETFNPTGMVVTATYSNGSQVVVDNYTYSPTTALTLQDTEISISYTDVGITVGTILNITVTNPIYGAIWDGTSTTKWTRTDAATNFPNPQPSVNNSVGSSPFDNIMPWSGMQKVNDPEAGILVSIPKYWYKWTGTGSGLQLQISNVAQDGFFVSPAHCDRGDGQGERDVVYVGRYHCASSSSGIGGIVYKSITGNTPLTNVTRSAFRTNIHNLGNTIYQWDWAMNWTIKMLYLVEFADWNSQNVIGYGCGNGNGTGQMGYTDAMQYHTGTTQPNRTTYGLGTQYRYIEGLWDNVYDWVDGCYYDANGLNIILNPANFSDTTGGTPIGIPVAGYPTALDVSEALGNQWVYPAAAGGSTDTYVPDNWGFSASYPCLFVGGNYGQSLNHGLFCMYYSTASNANSNIGSRLMKLPNNT